MVAFRINRPIQELCEPELFFGELVEELIRGDFKSKLDQTMICASGLCNRVMQCSGVWSGCKWDNTQMNDSLPFGSAGLPNKDQPNTRSEEHTSELQSLMRISYAVFCLKKKKNNKHK